MLHVRFNKIIIDNISNSSGVFTGNNLHYSWKASSVSNEGYGLLLGNNNCSLNIKSAIIKSGMHEVDNSTGVTSNSITIT
ncbi:MAG: hypothetical protein ACOYWZ_00750 [Bacillota bacterium]